MRMENSAERRCAIYQFNWGHADVCTMRASNRQQLMVISAVLTELELSGNCNASILAHRFEIESDDAPPTSAGFPP
jgi:hypothetical protein